MAYKKHNRAPLSKFKWSIKKGDNVLVIAGDDRGKTGIVSQILKSKHMVLIDGLNQVKKAVKHNDMKGANFVFLSKPIHLSNVKAVKI